jgi:hypothetical protein
VEKRENPIVNRLNKTKVEKFPDLREEKEARLKELGRRDRDAQQLRVSIVMLLNTSSYPSVALMFRNLVLLHTPKLSFVCLES